MNKDKRIKKRKLIREKVAVTFILNIYVNPYIGSSIQHPMFLSPISRYKRQNKWNHANCSNRSHTHTQFKCTALCEHWRTQNIVSNEHGTAVYNTISPSKMNNFIWLLTAASTDNETVTKRYTEEKKTKKNRQKWFGIKSPYLLTALVNKSNQRQRNWSIAQNVTLKMVRMFECVAYSMRVEWNRG